MIIRNQPITSRRDNEQLAWGNAPGGRQYDKRPARAKALLFFVLLPLQGVDNAHNKPRALSCAMCLLAFQTVVGCKRIIVKNILQTMKNLIHFLFFTLSSLLPSGRSGRDLFSLFTLHFSLFTLTLLLSSCSRTETNGEFGGNWQMTEWKQIYNDSLLATNETLQLHYTVHRDLIKFQKYSDNGIYYLATFHRTADSLVIDKIYHASIDTLVPFSQLSNIGFDSTGRFRIVHLTSKSLILSNTLFRLTFRKY